MLNYVHIATGSETDITIQYTHRRQQTEWLASLFWFSIGKPSKSKECGKLRDKEAMVHSSQSGKINLQ